VSTLEKINELANQLKDYLKQLQEENNEKIEAWRSALEAIGCGFNEIDSEFAQKGVLISAFWGDDSRYDGLHSQYDYLTFCKGDKAELQYFPTEPTSMQMDGGVYEGTWLEVWNRFLSEYDLALEVPKPPQTK